MIRRHQASAWSALLASLWISLAGLYAAPAPAQPAGAQGSEPWLDGPFAAAAVDLLGAAAEVAPPLAPERPRVLVLYHDAEHTFDRDGKALFRRHWVYRILDAAAIPEWSELEVRWSPWHQERPRLEARVVSPDGREARLTPEAVEEMADRQGRPDRSAPIVDPDRRRWLRARLPPLEVGSVVEVLTETHDLGPLFDAGTAARHYFVMFVPVAHSRLTLDVPKNLPLRFGVRKMEIAPSRHETDEHLRLTFAARDLPAAREVAEGIPGHRPRYPHVSFATGWTWQRVAARYHQLVERSLRSDLVAVAPDLSVELEGLMARPAADGTSSHDVFTENVRAVVAAVRDAVLHDGSELEASPPGPRRLSDILGPGHGNAVDVATVAVAALRHVGIDARVALVNAGFGVDVERQMPGLGLFNHALVYLPRPGDLPMWLDPGAAYSAPGHLPLVDQGRFALIVDPATDDLVRTPESTPDDNRAVEIREVWMADWGVGRMVETSHYYGSAGQTQRAVTGSLDPSARRRGYEAYARAFHRARELGQLDESDPRHLGDAFELRLELLGVGVARTRIDDATLVIPRPEIARRLPDVFQEELQGRRHEEFVFREPFVNEWRYTVHPPPGFAVGELPPDEEQRLGPATYTQRFWLESTERGMVVHAELIFDVGQRLITADQFERMHAAMRGFLARPPLTLVFTPRAEAETDVAGRLAQLARAVRDHPRVPSHRVRLARTLLDVGLVDEARRQAREAVALASNWSLSHQALGNALAHGHGGRFAGTGADVEAARQSLRTARGLDPDDADPQELLARLPAPPPVAEPDPYGLDRDPEAAEASPPWARFAFHPDDPATPLRQLLVAVADALHRQRDPAVDHLLTVFHADERQRLRRDGVGGYLDVVAPILAPHRPVADAVGGDADLEDLRHVQAEASGAPHLGYRLVLATGGRLWVTRQGDELVLAAHDRRPALLGLEAVRRLVQGDLFGARRWLGWALEEAKAGPATVEERVAERVFATLWHPEKDPDELSFEDLRAAEIRLAAAALASPLGLAGTSPDGVETQAIGWLRAAVDRGAGVTSLETKRNEREIADRRRAAGEALLVALLSQGQADEALLAEALERLDRIEADPALHARVLAAAGAWERLDTFLASRDPNASDLLRAHIALADARGQGDRAASLRQRLVARTDLNDRDLRAWVRALLSTIGRSQDVARDPLDPGVLATLQAHAERSTDPDTLRHVALAFAAARRPRAARALLVRAIENRIERGDDPDDAVVLGRVAEAGGLVDLARDLYTTYLSTTSIARADAAQIFYRQQAEARLLGMMRRGGRRPGL